MESLMPDVRDYEPHTALFGGDDGLDFYRKITEDAVGKINQGGYIFYEIGYDEACLLYTSTDQERKVEGSVDVIYKTLEMTGLKHDEGPDVGGEYGPYVQSERMGMYMKYALELVEKDVYKRQTYTSLR